MSQENPGSGSVSPANLPVKRKRGRPRKDESVVHGEKHLASSGIDAGKRNQPHQVNQTCDKNDIMVGQVVSGVIEGSFDAGYLLTVTVGNTNSVLRGVVFEPGLTVPVSAANDVAPHVKMLKRSQVHLNVDDPQTQMHGSNPISKERNGKSVKPLKRNEDSFSSPHVNQPNKVTPELLPVQLQTGFSVSRETIPSSRNNAPPSAPPLLQAEIKLVSSTCSPVEELSGDTCKVAQVSSKAAEFQNGNKSSPDKQLRKEIGSSSEPEGHAGNMDHDPLAMPLHTVHSEYEKQSPSFFESSESNRTVKTAELLQNKSSTVAEVSESSMDAAKDSLLEPNSGASIQNLEGIETARLIPQPEKQVLDCEHGPDKLVGDASEGPKLELSLTSVAADIAANRQTVGGDTFSEQVKLQQGNPASPNVDAPKELQPMISTEMPGVETPNSDESLPVNVIEAKAEDLHSMSETNTPVGIFQRQAMPSAAYNLEAELTTEDLHSMPETYSSAEMSKREAMPSATHDLVVEPEIKQSGVSEQVVKVHISDSAGLAEDVPGPQGTKSSDSAKKDETTSMEAATPADPQREPQQ